MPSASDFKLRHNPAYLSSALYPARSCQIGCQDSAQIASELGASAFHIFLNRPPLEAGINRFALKRQHREDTFVHPTFP